MSGTQIILCAVLAAFTALCGVAIYAHGYAGFFELATANWATALRATRRRLSQSRAGSYSHR